MGLAGTKERAYRISGGSRGRGHQYFSLIFYFAEDVPGSSRESYGIFFQNIHAQIAGADCIIWSLFGCSETLSAGFLYREYPLFLHLAHCAVLEEGIENG